MIIDLTKTPDYAIAWLFEWAQQAAQEEKEELNRQPKH